ncbi:MAG: carbon-nitrogen hydrolase family protein [Thermoleophilaceae bacterium]
MADPFDMANVTVDPGRTGALAAVAGQFASDPWRGLDQIERVVTVARGQGARLVVLPECALGGYPPVAGVSAGLAVDGPEIAKLASIAGEMVVCTGFVETAAGGPYSSAVCVSGDGVLGHHRKVHLPPSEASVFTPGSGFAAFDTPVGRIGMLICYDKVFPEAARTLALDGAEAIASMAAWPVCRFTPARHIAGDSQTLQFNILDQARAIENQVVWVSANHAGRSGGLRFVGQAKVVGPDGSVLATTGARAGVAVARVNIHAAISHARGSYSHLGDRAPDAYEMSGEPRPDTVAAALTGSFPTS